MQTSLIITTYNWPQALRAVLQSVLDQSALPDEVIVADDGSTDSTRQLIDEMRRNFPIPLIHTRQEDRGFRVARVRNLGASKAQGEYLIFIDGDMVMHRHFIKSHFQHRKKGRFLHGPRVLLANDLTEKYLTTGGRIVLHPFRKGITNRLNMIHCLWASHLLSSNEPSWRSRACNLSLFKSDFSTVNGFNEDFIGWGLEDSEFALRLTRAGVKKFRMRFCAVAYHLGHAQSNERTHNIQAARNSKLLDHVIESGTVRCNNGLSNHTSAEAL